MPYFLGEPLQYLGVEPDNPPNVFLRERAPTVNDDSELYAIGDIWIDSVLNNGYILADRTPTMAVWILLGGSVGAVQSLTGDVGAAVLPVAANINLQGGLIGAISFSNGGAGQMDVAVLVDGVTISIVGNQLVANGSLLSVPSDNGGPGVPLAGSFSILGSTSADFANASGIETHVGATTDQMYLENRRFLSAYVVDNSGVVGLRGEYTTVAAASTAANLAGGGSVYLRPGAYAGGFVWSANTDLIGVSANGNSTQVSITGTVTINAVGEYNASNIDFSIAAAPAINIMNATTVRFTDCNFSAGAGITVLCTAAGANLQFINCTFASVGGARALDIDCTQLLIAGGGSSIGDMILRVNTSMIMQDFFELGQIETVDNAVANCFSSQHSSGILESFNVNSVTSTINSSKSIVTSNAASTFFATGTGTFNYNDLTLPGTAVAIDPALTITSDDWKPYGDTVGVVGVNWYNPLHFAVNATTGQVSLIGGGIALDEINVDSISGTGTNPVVPDGAGAVTFTGAQVAASAFANVININSSLPNQYEAQIQRSSAVIAPNTAVNGVSHYDNTQFTIDADGFVQSLSSGVFLWVDVAAPAALALDTGFFVTAAGAVTLPAGVANGDTVEIVDVIGGGVIVTASGADIIQIQAAPSSAGGTATTTGLGDSVRLKFRLADLTWYSTSTGGNWNLA